MKQWNTVLLWFLGTGILLSLLLFRPREGWETLAQAETRPLLIVMYHSVLKDPARAGAYVVSPETVRADLSYLQKLGYTYILPSEAIAFVQGRGSLPQKPLLLTFDDGHMNNLTYVLPILEELDGKALINAVGSYTEAFSNNPDSNPNYAYLSWDQLEELAASNRVEIGNHSWNLHSTGPRKGILPLSGEDAFSHQNLVRTDLCRMEGELKARNLSSGVFAYPFGAMNPDCAALVRALGFSMTLTCREGISTIKAGDPSSLLSLCRYNRPAGPTSSAFFDEILKGGE